MNTGRLHVRKLAPERPSVKQIGALDLRVGATYFAIGFAPITALAISVIGLVPLHYGAPFVVLPAMLVGLAVALRYPEYGKLAARGLAIGLFAVLLYDCTRFPFIIAGVWGDFIPNIAKFLLNSTEPNWAIGYAWRYLGNGGGMGLAFVVGYGVMRPKMNRWMLATGYGVAIWCCLLMTLFIAPHGEELLFELTPLTFSLSLLGHVVYGAALAWGLSLFGFDVRRSA